MGFPRLIISCRRDRFAISVHGERSHGSNHSETLRYASLMHPHHVTGLAMYSTYTWIIIGSWVPVLRVATLTWGEQMRSCEESG